MDRWFISRELWKLGVNAGYIGVYGEVSKRTEKLGLFLHLIKAIAPRL